MASAAEASGAAVAARSPAADRRLRQRRHEARLRLRLAQDAVVLACHHASAPPRLEPARTSPAEIDALRGEIADLKGKLVALLKQVSDLLHGGHGLQVQAARAAASLPRAAGPGPRHGLGVSHTVVDNDEASVAAALEPAGSSARSVQQPAQPAQPGHGAPDDAATLGCGKSRRVELRFDATVSRTDAESARLGLSFKEHNGEFVIRRIEAGLVRDWNASNPQSTVRTGDCIFAVNGSCCLEAMDKEMLSATLLHFIFVRYSSQPEELG